MKIENRAYGGKKFRPSPVYFKEDDLGLFLCITPWGPQGVAETVIDSIKSFFSLTNEDSEVTVPFEKKPSLDRKGNSLRMAVILASEKVNKQFNTKSYTAGFEIFAGLCINDNWTYVCCGQPSFLLLRNTMGALPIHSSMDLNIKLCKQNRLDPLPSHILGMDQRPPIQFGSHKLLNGDRYALISRSYVPTSFFQMENRNKTLESISHVLAMDCEDMPYSLALIHFE